jgi:hypothetical protein
VVKQLINKALTGNMPAARIYLGLRQQALEKAALSAPQQSIDPGKYDNAKNFTDEELLRMIAAGLEKEKQEGGKGHVSSTN